MTTAEVQWSEILAEAGVPSPGGASDVALERVTVGVPSIASHGFSDAGLLLALRLAATSGAVHERVAKVDDWYRQRRLSARDAVSPRTPYSPRAMAIAVMTLIFAAVGPVLAFPSIRTRSDYFLPLESAAVISGALALVSAIWFLIAEVARIPFAGTQRRLYGPALSFIFVGLVAVALATTVIRVSAEDGLYGLVPVGLALQSTAIAVYVVAAIRAKRTQAATPASITGIEVPVHQDALDETLRKRMDAALAGASRTGYDRAAAVDGVRQLVEAGDLSSDRAVAALRSLMK